MILYTYEHTNIRDRVAGDAVNLKPTFCENISSVFAQREPGEHALRVDELIREVPQTAVLQRWSAKIY
jgi:hypothetical protein